MTQGWMGILGFDGPKLSKKGGNPSFAVALQLTN